MQQDNYYLFLKAIEEWIAIVRTITLPPIIVSILGCSRMTSQTQRGPKMVSSKKKRLTSAAVMYLGARVTQTTGIAIQNMHIIWIIIKSLFYNFIWSTKKRANNETTNFPIIAEGSRLIFLADLIITALTAKPVAQTKPNKFPKKSPESIAS